MSRPVMRAAAAVAALLLASCASVAPRPQAPAVPPAQAQAAQQARAQALAAIPDWSLQGRVAISNGDKGGSGRLDWRQDGAGYRVALSAPVTRQSWQLEAGPQGARLDGLEGGARSGADAGLLLREATGWDIPVGALGDWVRGLAGPGERAVAYGEDGHLRRIEADGWVIDYQEWMPASGGFPAMPRRLQAERGGARVRLVVDGWNTGP